MSAANQRFNIDHGWQILLSDLGLSQQDLLRHARLPLDIFSRISASLTVEEYFRLWDSLEHLLDDPAFSLRLGQSITVEAFSPPLFACFCSRDMNAAFARLSRYKPLIGPLRLNVTTGLHETVAIFSGLPDAITPPPSLIAAELVFLVQMARMATREMLVPSRIVVPAKLAEIGKFEAFFRTAVTHGLAYGVAFRAEDARKSFLTANEGMWSIFEPELRARLENLGREDGFQERVRACLLEMLASGQYNMSDVADRLAVSTRTLQRRLRDDKTNFQNELNKLRAEMARHYLATSQYSSAEISFLLGYDDPNSFIRAFHNWTGQTPEQARTEAQFGG